MTLLGSYSLFWFVVGFIFLVMEVLTPGIVFVFFGLGAWLVMALTFIMPNLGSSFQFLIFIVSSVVFLFLLRRHVTDLFKRMRKDGPTDSLSEPMVAEKFLGQTVEVVKDITPEHPGLVELNGTNWTAQSSVAISAGQRARVIELTGLTFWVEKV
jgi:membrane protein implicated in regulation of membrane protease activity